MEVTKTDMTTLPKIVAVDFDGTLVEDKYPLIGKPNKTMFDICKALKKFGVHLILWTCRDGTQLLDAVAFCEQNGLYFDAVNSNIPETIHMFNNDTRKVYADLYIDDKSIPHIQDPLFWCHRLEIEPFQFVRSAFDLG